MKTNESKYRALEKLPPNALTVRKYADNTGITTSHVYKLHKLEQKIEIVVFQGVNFVLPLR